MAGHSCGLHGLVQILTPRFTTFLSSVPFYGELFLAAQVSPAFFITCWAVIDFVSVVFKLYHLREVFLWDDFFYTGLDWIGLSDTAIDFKSF